MALTPSGRTSCVCRRASRSSKAFYLSTPDRERLHDAGKPAGEPMPAGTYARRILEKLLVDLAWVSSRMEGNTYDILQTKQLVKFGEEATGKDRKEAIQYLVDNIDEIGINRQDICNIHALLSDGLLIDPAMTGPAFWITRLSILTPSWPWPKPRTYPKRTVKRS